jgi:hypothetical protein
VVTEVADFANWYIVDGEDDDDEEEEEWDVLWTDYPLPTPMLAGLSPS